MKTIRSEYRGQKRKTGRTNNRLGALLFFLFTSLTMFAQPSEVRWKKLDFLIGDWRGEGSGEPGKGGGGFSFRPDLNQTILVRKNHSEYPPVQGKPKVVHDDLMVVYQDITESQGKAIYFDNEGHVINYSISMSGNNIVFVSEVTGQAPRFRLTYSSLDPRTITVKFEIAPPGQPDKFSTYVEGKCVKVDQRE